MLSGLLSLLFSRNKYWIKGEVGEMSNGFFLKVFCLREVHEIKTVHILTDTGKRSLIARAP